MKLAELKTKLEKLKNLSEMDLSELNKKIDEVEKKINEGIKRVKKVAEEENINIEIHGSYTVGSVLFSELGVYLKQTYVKEFNEYTAKINKRFLLWYQVRDSIFDFYKLINSEISNNKIKSTYSFDQENEQVKILKEYKNGKIDYEKNQDLLDIIFLAKKIKENFEN